MELGAVTFLESVRQVVDYARACEAAGISAIGLGDTVPSLYQDAYATSGACLAATSRLQVGPTVTNTVSRHWSVLASTARTFEELAPGRFFAGIGTGDGAVHSVGLKPSSWQQLESDVKNLKPMAPPNFRIHIAASGPRGAEAAGRNASDFMIGTGLDVDALRQLSDRARAARAQAGVATPLRTWAVVSIFIVPDAETARRVRVEMRPRATGFARFAFASTFESKAVPERWHALLRERLAHYDFGAHGVAGATSNASMFDDRPDLLDYLMDRFLVIGTAEQCADRLRSVASQAGLHGFWLAMGRSEVAQDPVAMVGAAGEALADLMTPPD
jgi:alkanesulfonate monooxygenase SsuD/methylene tetrahydromethanopterin reductase-like flavin-dependent oxidoreductase (luciferase family)